jgi:Fe(3+) dicitrate transport protein
MVRINAIAISISALLSTALAVAQDGDSLRTSRLDEVVIHGEKLFTIERLPDIQGTWLWAGKKNGLINVQKLDANITEKTARQIFSKVPGVFVYDMDGSGNQINISTRDLDLHRGWESNIRKKNFYPGFGIATIGR